MKIGLNNQEITIQSGTSIKYLMEEKGWFEKTGIAVALNNAVIPQRNWESTILEEKDTIMIITATAGG